MGALEDIMTWPKQPKPYDNEAADRTFFWTQRKDFIINRLIEAFKEVAELERKLFEQDKVHERNVERLKKEHKEKLGALVDHTNKLNAEVVRLQEDLKRERNRASSATEAAEEGARAAGYSSRVNLKLLDLLEDKVWEMKGGKK